METTYQSQTYSGNAPNEAVGPDIWAGITVYYFNNATKIIHVWSRLNDLLIRFSFTSDAVAGGVLNWNDPIQVNDAPQSEPFYHSCQAFQVINQTAGAVAWFQVVGMW